MAISNFPTIQLLPKNPIENMEISCVYRIWFGKKYYIGKTKDLRNRIRCHEYDLRRHIKNYDLGIINVFYQHMVRHAIDNKITKCYYEVLGMCKDENARVGLEQSWFNACCDDINCLNYGFESFAYIPPKNPKPKVIKIKTVKPIRIPKPKKLKPPPKLLTYKQQIAALKRTLKKIQLG